MNLEAVSIWEVLKAWSWRCNSGRKYRERKAGWGFICGVLRGLQAEPSRGASWGGWTAAVVGEEENQGRGAPSQAEVALQSRQGRKRAEALLWPESSADTAKWPLDLATQRLPVTFGRAVWMEGWRQKPGQRGLGSEWVPGTWRPGWTVFSGSSLWRGDKVSVDGCGRKMKKLFKMEYSKHVEILMGMIL